MMPRSVVQSVLQVDAAAAATELLGAAEPPVKRVGVCNPPFRCSSRFNDRHFQSSINSPKRLLESVHSGGVANIEDTVNLRHVPTKPPPKFSLGDSLLSHRVIQLNLWHGQYWNTDHYPSL